MHGPAAGLTEGGVRPGRRGPKMSPRDTSNRLAAPHARPMPALRPPHARPHARPRFLERRKVTKLAGQPVSARVGPCRPRPGHRPREAPEALVLQGRDEDCRAKCLSAINRAFVGELDGQPLHGQRRLIRPQTGRFMNIPSAAFFPSPENRILAQCHKLGLFRCNQSYGRWKQVWERSRWPSGRPSAGRPGDGPYAANMADTTRHWGQPRGHPRGHPPPPRRGRDSKRAANMAHVLPPRHPRQTRLDAPEAATGYTVGARTNLLYIGARHCHCPAAPRRL